MHKRLTVAVKIRRWAVVVFDNDNGAQERVTNFINQLRHNMVNLGEQYCLVIVSVTIQRRDRYHH